MKEKMYLLYDYCQSGNYVKLKTLLRENRDLDLTQRDGIYFYLSIKHNNIKMLNILLDYYEETKLQGDREGLEYKFAKHQLSNIFEEAEDRLDISPEIQEIISPYMPTDEDSDDDLSGFGDLADQWDDEEAGYVSDNFSHDRDEAEDFWQDHSSSPRTPIEFPEDSANPDSYDYSDILRQENSPMLEAVRQNLDAHGFRLPDEIATLEEAIVALEKISSGLGYVYSGRDYETNKEFIERQITDIKLSASAAADVGRFSRLVGSAEDLPQDVIAAHSVKTPEVFSPHYDSPINDQAPGSELIGEA